MRAIDVARLVHAKHTAILFRRKKGCPDEYDVKDIFQGSKKGWTYLDAFSASALVQVHDALKEENRGLLMSRGLINAVEWAFKVIKKCEGK